MNNSNGNTSRQPPQPGHPSGQLQSQPRPHLLVVGASSRSLVNASRKLGINAWGIDLFGDVDNPHSGPPIALSEYPYGFLPHLQKIRPQYWTFTGGLEGHRDFLSKGCEFSRLISTSLESITKVRDVRHLQILLDDLGLPSAWFLANPNDQNSDQAAPVEKTRHLLRKSLTSSGGQGVSRIPISDFVPSKDFCWMREIHGRLLGVSYFGRPPNAFRIGATLQLSGVSALNAPEFSYCGSIGPIDRFEEFERALSDSDQIAGAAAERFNLCGLFGLDLIDDGSETFLLEINPRYTASMELLDRVSGQFPLAEHFDLLSRESLQGGQSELASLRHSSRVNAQHSFLSMGSETSPENKTAPAESNPVDSIVTPLAAKGVLYAPGERTLSISNRFVDECLAANQGLQAAKVADIPQPKVSVHPGEPLMSLFVDWPPVTPLVQNGQHWAARQFEGSEMIDELMQQVFRAADHWAKLAGRTC